MQINQRIKTSTPESKFDADLEQELQSNWFKLWQLLTNGLSFADNFNAQIINVADTGAANTEFTVAHTLKRIPSGFITIKNNKAGVVYDSGSSWTTSNIYLKCSVANCAITLIAI